MTDSVKARRPYDSSRRQVQARDTRLRVLRAAHDLFVTQGYGRTTIADIARAADVSAETIYARFKNKMTVLHEVWDITIGGDDQDVVFHERPEIKAIRAEPDLRRRFLLHARMSTIAARRMAPFLLALRGAAASEPAAAAMLAEVDRQRLAGLGVMAREAAATGQLAVSEQECLDLIWSTTDGVLWHRLVAERGWSDEQYAECLATMWNAAMTSTPGQAASTGE
jgi:AcrR family transcriptional regulator